MRRTTSLTAAGLLGLALLTPFTSASAAGETCRGEAATIVGTPDASVKGTEGRDVIVTAGARSVNALGGDDLVCVTGGSETYLTGDAGNDVVDATQAGPAKLVASLGDGDDTFVGAAPTLEVWGSSFFYADTGVDDLHVTALPGAVVRVESGAPAQPNSDRVRVDGSGNVRWQGLPTTSSVLAGGSRDSRLDADLPDGALTVDLRKGRAVAVEPGPNSALRWSEFDSFRFRAGYYGRTVSSLDLTGTAGDDRVDLDLRDDGIRVRARMGRGDDMLRTGIVGGPGSSYAGGGGRDLLGVDAYGNVELDLTSGRLWARLSRKAYRATVRSFQDAHVSSRTAHVVGDADDNVLTIGGCKGAVAEGRAGADTITYDPAALWEDTPTCSRRDPQRYLGGRGNDVLVADAGDDVLVGGAGRDRADGGDGTDRCSAEQEERCEA